MKLFVFGMGYSARAAVQWLQPQTKLVFGTTRDRAKMPGIAAMGVQPLQFDSSIARSGSSAETFSRKADWGEVANCLAQTDHVLLSIAPDETGDPAFDCFRNNLAAVRPRSIVYLSTVGVYGDHEGAWVDEASACRPVSRRSRQRVEAEAAWRRWAEETGIPVAIIRLSGIYGPGRGPFAKIRRGTARRIIKPGQVFNRIHVDDIAAIVEAAFAHQADGFFNGTDDEPAPPQEVLAYAAALLGVPPPPEIPFDKADLTPMARSFYGENKRVRNDRIKAVLGVRLAYPSYREGLAATLRAEGQSVPADLS